MSESKTLKLEITGINGTWHDSHYKPDAKVAEVIAGFRDHVYYRRKDMNYDLYDSRNPAKALDDAKTLDECGIADGTMLVFVDREAFEKIKVGDKVVGE